MNPTTIGHIPSSNLKRIKGQYVATVAGVALALSAVVAFPSITTTTKPVAPTRAALAQGVVRSDIARHTFIIAASVAQQADLESANSDLRSFDPQRNDITVLLAGSPAAGSFLDEGARELMAIGASFNIVDMTSVTSVVRPEAKAQASEADIGASVLSTELANFAAPAGVSKSFSDGDVMDAILAGPPAGHSVMVAPDASQLEAHIAASVLSTELAHFPTASQRVVSEADIMASVISTEKAAGY